MNEEVQGTSPETIAYSFEDKNQSTPEDLSFLNQNNNNNDQPNNKNEEQQTDEADENLTKNGSLLCVGDEFSGRTTSYPWVYMMQARHCYFRFLERSYVGAHTYWFLQRIRGERYFNAQHLPSHITFQMGVYDIFALIQALRSSVAYANGLPKDYEYTLDKSFENITKIIQIFQERVPTAKIGVISLAPIGEDTSSEINQTVKQWNERLKKFAETVNNCTYFPLGDELFSDIDRYYDPQHPPPGPFPPPPSFQLSPSNLLLRSRLTITNPLFTSWNNQTLKNGYHFLVDGLHLNELSGTLLMDMIENWLEKYLFPGKKQLVQRLGELRAQYNHQNWMPDQSTICCVACKKNFQFFERRHHCRECGLIFCGACTPFRINEYLNGGERVCYLCFVEHQKKNSFSK